MKKSITILVGNIGSGKSFWAQKNRKKNQVVVSRDGLRYMLGGGIYVFESKIESIIWKAELNIIEGIMEKGFSIIIDGVGVNASLRKRYIDLAKLYTYEIMVVELPRLSMQECVDRRMTNPHGQPNRKLWETVWKKFEDIYEEPMLDEGIVEILKVQEIPLIDTVSLNLS